MREKFGAVIGGGGGPGNGTGAGGSPVKNASLLYRTQGSSGGGPLN